MRNVFSVDLEDWFHILDTDASPPISEWGNMESRVERNTDQLVELLQLHGVKATFFVLGWIAEKYPRLVERISQEGHEIASHGYSHELLYRQSPDGFREDLGRAAKRITDACGKRPLGYRAPGFSLVESSLWALNVLADEGYQFDSSVFPANRGHGGLLSGARLPKILPNGVREFPITTIQLGSRRFAYLGGGYLRFFPESLILRWATKQSSIDIPLILYIHPRDIDGHQPRLNLGKWRNFKSYFGLNSCLRKLDSLLANFEWGRFEDYADTPGTD